MCVRVDFVRFKSRDFSIINYRRIQLTTTAQQLSSYRQKVGIHSDVLGFDHPNYQLIKPTVVTLRGSFWARGFPYHDNN